MAASETDNSAEAQARRLERVDAQLAALLQPAGVQERLRASPGENEWSAMQILGHLAEMIPFWMNQCRRSLAATGEPPTFGRAPGSTERMAGVERGEKSDPDELLRTLHVEVLSAARAIRAMTPEQRSRQVHTREKEITIADAIEDFIVHHAEEHLAQIQAALSGNN